MHENSFFHELPADMTIRRYPVLESWPDLLANFELDAGGPLAPHLSFRRRNDHKLRFARPEPHHLDMRQLVVRRDQVIAACVYYYDIYLHWNEIEPGDQPPTVGYYDLCLNLNLQWAYTTREFRSEGASRVLADGIAYEAGCMLFGIWNQLRQLPVALQLVPDVYAAFPPLLPKAFVQRVFTRYRTETLGWNKRHHYVHPALLNPYPFG